MIEMPEKSVELVLQQEQILNAILLATRRALDVPDGWMRHPNGRAFVPPPEQETGYTTTPPTEGT